ncbi:hypothetical protein CLAVI_001003, partial [Candidatus Clavichlamydia salmonicola]|uniref:hypothetical protein n=1 Tax=Candidatus Clavichlamydia salmonicola TaxID=469812 RepID=UPI001890FA51
FPINISTISDNDYSSSSLMTATTSPSVQVNFPINISTISDNDYSSSSLMTATTSPSVQVNFPINISTISDNDYSSSSLMTATTSPSVQANSPIDISTISDNDYSSSSLITELSLQENFFIKVSFSKKKCMQISQLLTKKYPRWNKFIQLSEKCLVSATSYNCLTNIKEIKIKKSTEPIELFKILYLTVSNNYLLYKSTGRLKNNYEEKLVNLLEKINIEFCQVNKEKLEAKQHSSVLLDLINTAIGKDIPFFYENKIISPQYHISLKQHQKKNLVCIEIHDCFAYTPSEFLRSKAHYQKRTTEFIKKILSLPTINISAKNIFNIQNQDNVATISLIPHFYLLMQYNKKVANQYIEKKYTSCCHYKKMQTNIADSLKVLSHFAHTHSIPLSDEELDTTTNPLFQTQASVIPRKLLFLFPIFSIRSYNLMKNFNYKFYYSVKKASNIPEQKHSAARSLKHSINIAYKLLSEPAKKISFYTDPADENVFTPIRTKAALVESLYSGFLENWFYYKKNQDTLLSSTKRKPIFSELETLLNTLKSKAAELSIPLPVITESVILNDLAKQINKSLKEEPIQQKNDLEITVKSVEKPIYLIPIFSLKITKAVSRSTITSQAYTYYLSYALNTDSMSRCHGYAHARDTFKKTSQNIKQLCQEDSIVQSIYTSITYNSHDRHYHTKTKFLLKVLERFEDALSFLGQYYPILLETTKTYHPKEDFENNIALIKKTLTKLGEKLPQSPPPSKLKKILLKGIKKHKTTIPRLNEIVLDKE